MPPPPDSTEFPTWLAAKGLPQDGIEWLIELSTLPELFESPQRIMEPDSWFYFPGNTRFILIGSCPNGDAVALDTVEQPGAVFFIDHDRVHEDIPDLERTVRVADSLADYADQCENDPDFPFEYGEAKSRPASEVKQTAPAAEPSAGQPPLANS